MPREPLLTPAFVLCFGASFVQGLAFHLYLHLPGFLAALGASALVIGLLGGLASAAALLSRPAVARVLDGPGRRPVILLGGAGNVLVLTLYFAVDAIGPLVYAVRILHGVAEAMLFVGFFTFAADVIPESRRTQGIAVFGVSGMLPISLGPLLGDWILRRGSYGDLFAASVALAALSFALSLPLRDRRPVHDPALPSRGFAAALVQRDLRPLWLVGTAFATAITGPFLFMKLFVEETGIGSLGLFFSAYSLSAIGLRLTLGWLPDRAGPKRVLFPSLVCLAAGLGALAHVRGEGTLAAAGVLCGLGHGMTFPILNGLVIARARRSERGAAMAIYTAVFDAGPLLGGPLFGAILGQAGFGALSRCAAALVLAGGLAFAVTDRGR